MEPGSIRRRVASSRDHRPVSVDWLVVITMVPSPRNSTLDPAASRYAQRRYAVLTGAMCPLAGGKTWKQMDAREREADRAARRQISAELGHDRLKITDTYLGSAF